MGNLYTVTTNREAIRNDEGAGSSLLDNTRDYNCF